MNYNQWLLKETGRKFSNQYCLALALLKVVNTRTEAYVYTKRPVVKKNKKNKIGTHCMNLSDYRIEYWNLTKYDLGSKQKKIRKNTETITEI